MKVHYFKKFILLSILLLGSSKVSFAACDQTISVGANVASAVSSAGNGTTICLNAGDYGAVNLDNISRSGYVTVRSVNPKGATLGYTQIGNSDYIRIEDIVIGGAIINSCSSNIQIVNNLFTSGLLVTMRDNTCSANLNLLVDGNSFGDIGPAFYEGRISVADDDGPQVVMGLIISNNTIGPGCLSDGIQIAGGASGVVIGPGNIFDGMIQSGPIHCDAIQFYGTGENNIITGNWFKNNSVVLTHHTGAPNGTVFTHNLISDVAQIQIGQSTTFTFEHNTIYNVTDVFSINSGTTNASIRNNIVIGNTPGIDTTGNGGCINCTISYNLFGNSGIAIGTNYLIGTPTFIGGSNPTTWAGYQLTPSSLGYQAASDGKDMGANSFGSGTGIPVLIAPMNLRVQ